MSGQNPNNLNVGMRCVKYMIFVINLMFVLTAMLLLTVGTTIQTIFSDFSHFLDDNFLSPPSLMVAAGIILLIVALFGCVGAIRESTMLINVYALLLSFIFVLQVSAAISAFILRGQVKEMLVRTMNESIVNYNENKQVAEAVDFMQSMLECCGVTDPNDWSGILDRTNNATDVAVPDSCCAQFMDDDHNNCLSFHNVGCFNKMNFIITQSTMLLAVGATTVAFVQILGVICAFMLAKTIRRTKSLRAARRWQLQQSLGIMAKSFGTQIYDPEYTQMEKSEKGSEPSTYLPNSPSVN